MISPLLDKNILYKVTVNADLKTTDKCTDISMSVVEVVDSRFNILGWIQVKYVGFYYFFT